MCHTRYSRSSLSPHLNLTVSFFRISVSSRCHAMASMSSKQHSTSFTLQFVTGVRGSHMPQLTAQVARYLSGAYS